MFSGQESDNFPQRCLGEPILDRAVEAVVRPAQTCGDEELYGNLGRMVIENGPGQHCKLSNVMVESCTATGMRRCC